MHCFLIARAYLPLARDRHGWYRNDSEGEGGALRSLYDAIPFARTARRILLSSVALISLVLADGCGAGSARSLSSTGPSEATRSMEAPALRCGTREVYMPKAMNAKLADLADFAATVPVRTVSTCDDARTFWAAYATYSAAHPSFDAHQPVAAPFGGRPPAAPNVPSVYLTNKILQGAPVGDPPVVLLQAHICAEDASKHTPTSSMLGPTACQGDSEQCTGTFIAKNWILTAAHCVLPNVGLPFTDPVSGTAIRGITTDTTEADGYFTWTINWSLPSGDLIKSATDLSSAPTTVVAQLQATSLQYVHPGWVGWVGGPGTPGAADAAGAYDLALIYVPWEENDAFLPPDPSVGSAMAISLVPPTSADVAEAYGVNGAGTQRGVFSGQTFTVDPSQTTLSVIASNLTPQFCPGDSGGPAVRLTFSNGLGTSGPGEEAIVGLTHSTAGPELVNCSTKGSTVIWARVDNDIGSSFDFIQKSMRNWNGDDFACNEFAESGTSPTFAQCWKQSCNQDSDCALPNDGSSSSASSADGASGVPVVFCSHPSPTGAYVGQCLTYHSDQGDLSGDSSSSSSP